jgi:hypothetical protein
MFSKLIIVALVGVTHAQNYAYEKADESEVWTFTTDAKVSAANLDLLEARVAAIEDNQGMVVSGVKLAQSSMERVDGIVSEVSVIRQELSNSISLLETKHRVLVDTEGVADMEYQINKELGDAVNADKRAGDAAKAGIVSSVNNLKAKATALNDAVQGRIDTMQAKIDDAVQTVKEKGAFYGSAEHIKQVCGFHPLDEVEKYWDGKVITSASDHGNVRGRKFYRVKFNLVRKGFFTSGSDELFLACKGLDMYLRSVDGIGRDLRPPCNHYGHMRVGGLGQCIFIWDSYFSHCGGGGYWRQNQACGGIPEEYLRMSVQYETTWHNWDRHYAHFNGVNNHGWVNPYQESPYEYSFCTSGNMNYNK